MLPSNDVCHKARLARDPRFDGKFFTAVKTTGIYCRSICPATPPREENVRYYSLAISAARAGFRPCLRCRPDSAPGSAPWKGVNTSLERAIRLIDEGALQQGSIVDLAERLGMSDRHLRQIFQKNLGISPKDYALYQQCLFAKQLLHQTQLPITQIALASGFSSIRRFNDCFQKQLALSPTKLRQAHLNAGSKAHSTANSKVQTGAHKSNHVLTIKLYYRPPYDWAFMQGFLMKRAVPGLEWGDEHSYGRTFLWQGCGRKSNGRKNSGRQDDAQPANGQQMIRGKFTASHIKEQCRFDVDIELDEVSELKAIVNNIRRILDVDLDMQAIEQDLHLSFSGALTIKTGLRLPGIWDPFEAGIRAILGQQISVAAAHTLLTTLVTALGERVLGEKIVGERAPGERTANEKTQQDKAGYYLFPAPKIIAASELEFLKIPASRKQTLRNLARHYLEHDNPDDPDLWLFLKGIGPWTVNYAKLRGMSHPDIFMGTDLGVMKALKKQRETVNSTDDPKSDLGASNINSAAVTLNQAAALDPATALDPAVALDPAAALDPDAAAPWRSYLTIQLWSQLV